MCPLYIWAESGHVSIITISPLWYSIHVHFIYKTAYNMSLILMLCTHIVTAWKQCIYHMYSHVSVSNSLINHVHVSPLCKAYTSIAFKLANTDGIRVLMKQWQMQLTIMLVMHAVIYHWSSIESHLTISTFVDYTKLLYITSCSKTCILINYSMSLMVLVSHCKNRVFLAVDKYK